MALEQLRFRHRGPLGEVHHQHHFQWGRRWQLDDFAAVSPGPAPEAGGENQEAAANCDGSDCGHQSRQLHCDAAVFGVLHLRDCGHDGVPPQRPVPLPHHPGGAPELVPRRHHGRLDRHHVHFHLRLRRVQQRHLLRLEVLRPDLPRPRSRRRRLHLLRHLGRGNE